MPTRLALLFLLLTLSIHSSAQHEWSEVYRSAAAYYQQRNLSEAFQEATQALVNVRASQGINSAQYAEGLQLLTLTAAAGGHYAQALDYTQQQIKVYQLLSPPPITYYRQALQQVALLHWQLGHDSLAIDRMKQALVLSDSLASDETHTIITYQLAKMLHQSGQVAAADSLYQMIIATQEDTTRLAVKSAYYQSLLLQRADPRHTIDQLQQLGDTLNSTYADACYRWGQAQQDSGRWQQADQLYRKAERVYQAMPGMDSAQYASIALKIGGVALAQGEGQEGVRWIEKAYRLRIWQHASTEAPYWQAVDALASALVENQRLTEAVALYHQHLPVDSSSLTYPWQYAVVLNNLAMIYQQERHYTDAATYYRQAVQHLERQPRMAPAGMLQQASIYCNTASNYQHLYRFDSAVSYFKKATELISGISGTHSDAYVAAIAGLAALYHDIGYYAQADVFYQEALKIQETLTGKENSTYANLLNNYALVLQAQGDGAQASELLVQSLRTKEALLGMQHPEYTAALMNIGLVQLEAGNYTTAQPLLEQAFTAHVTQWGETHPKVIQSYLSLAQLATAQGNYTDAEPLLQQALSIAKAHERTDPVAYAHVQIEVANLYMALGNYTSAQPFLLESKNILQHHYGYYHPEYATVTQNLATLYEAQGQKDTAEILYQEALEVDKRVYGEQHPAYAVTLNNLATLYLNQQQYEKALPLLEASGAISQGVYGEAHPAHTTTLLNLGLLYQDIGRYPEATQYIEQVATIRQQTLGEKHPDYAYALYAQAVLYHRLGRMHEAKAVFAKVIDQYVRQIQTYFPALSEQEKSAFYRRIEPVVAAFRNFVIDQVVNDTLNRPPADLLADLYDLQLITKAMLLDASNKIRRTILESGRSELIAQYHRWLEGKETLFKLYASPREEWQQQRERIAFLEKSINQLEKQLSQSSTDFASNLESQQLTWQDVQAQLQPGEAALELIRVAQEAADKVVYVALAVTADAAAPMVSVMRNGRAMEKKNFHYYQNAISFKIEDHLSYDLYWQPIAQMLPGDVRTVYVSADGIYHKISLNSLYHVASQRYLIEERSIRMLSSTRQLVQPALLTDNRRAYLVGFPNYQFREEDAADTAVDTLETVPGSSVIAKSATGDMRLANAGLGISFPTDFQVLTGTKQEVHTIAALLGEHDWQSQTWLADQAQEERLKLITSPRLLHIATHGYFMDDLPTQEKPRYGTPRPAFTANPLLRSGLLLAGAQQAMMHHHHEAPAEDGILTAYEAMNLNLNGTELVVLSACETGLGEIKNGEGVYGLQRAFMVAGASSVLMSLWKVNDQSTTEMMQLFYHRWLRGDDKFKALQVAQQEMLQKYRHPYYWAAFVMIGQ